MSKLSSVHPFANIPPIGTPVTNVALADILCPLLAGTYSLTTAMAELTAIEAPNPALPAGAVPRR